MLAGSEWDCFEGLQNKKCLQSDLKMEKLKAEQNSSDSKYKIKVRIKISRPGHHWTVFTIVYQGALLLSFKQPALNRICLKFVAMLDSKEFIFSGNQILVKITAVKLKT